MKKLLLLPFLCLSMLLSAQNWMYDFEEASIKAQKEGKLILLHFSGSDWDAPSRQMKEEIFESTAFQQFSDEHLILVLADFPRKIKNRLSRNQSLHNESLALRFNSEEQFPNTLLLDTQGKKIYSWKGIPASSPDIFIAGIKQFSFRVSGQKMFTHTAELMGSRFDFTLVCSNQDWADRCFEKVVSEITRIDQMLAGEKNGNGEVWEINENAGIQAVVVEKELFEIIRSAKKIAIQTRGAFDITYAGLDEKIWPIGGRLEQLPDPASMVKAIHLIDYEKVVMNDALSTVFLTEQGMKMDLGGVKKGYATEKAKVLLRQLGITAGVINTEGSLTAWGRQPGGEYWTVATAGPGDVPATFSYLKIKDQAIVSSDGAEKFVTIADEDHRYIIDPRSGFAVEGLKSVTIICPDAILAEGLASAVFVMGELDGIDLINQLEDVEGVIIDEAGKLYTSNNIEISQ